MLWLYENRAFSRTRLDATWSGITVATIWQGFNSSTPNLTAALANFVA
jgi:hypothetical protein